ncbi:MAG: 5-methyltetrahydropteroyltriglutamate--homocysteine S-methyltransferase [Acidobacteria bacterium 13_1_40CM_65_14]|nr:MAG: 5-methyltetrahydropteroyltriglutamate--homocysteine S-methyltransferase [Acidobacteria bacterium 13_1_40CM_65_14]OLD16028.1 MAG: 5-methyltetrahydropteroyltriglutamate--homocysteine S-methyltransferase [Acidobacteria bacterium 13_1_40CM_3_65_5]OLE84382.1 MAG: 5-methyltetrahydropteroyltriglutamate--homocysteine S-methyltransferase [Acidobacteria bacterium 13_1_20CM_2_65_9]
MKNPAKLNPPFRADHVGSLLRPQPLLDARRRHRDGEISGEELRAVEDTHIRDVVGRQEAVGLSSITDGEFRRTFFHIDFLEQLQGVTVTGGIETKFKGRQGEINFAPPSVSVTGKLRHVTDIQKRDFEFLKSVTRQTPKVTIPSPTMVHFRGGRQTIDIEAYPDMSEFFADLAQCYRDEVDSLYRAGCRYLQMDDTNLAYLCDPKLRAGARDRGHDPDQLPRAYAALINSVIDGRPKDLTVAVHLCRGNFKSAWVAEGGYEPVADVLFNELNVDAYFLEYDDERAGDFRPLRFVPKGKTVVLGLVTTKAADLESRADLLRRVEEAARYMPIENMCLSPQCGFSSTVEGNQITERDQWAKLQLVVDTAGEIWETV